MVLFVCFEFIKCHKKSIKLFLYISSFFVDLWTDVSHTVL